MDTKERLLTALESETGLHSKRGYIVNKAPELLALIRKEGHKQFVEESRKHQYEWNSAPQTSIARLREDFLNGNKAVRRICKELGVVGIPISENGAGKGEKRDIQEKPRLFGYQGIFSAEENEAMGNISGIHIHVDQAPGHITQQYNSLTALVPTIAFTSTSPITINPRTDKIENGVNCHRYFIIADPNHGAFARVGEERGYISSLKDLARRDIERLARWEEEFEKNRDTIKNLPQGYSFLDYFQKDNTGYSDVRKRDDIGKGTLELRVNDTTTADIMIAQAALVSGYMNRMIGDKIPLAIGTRKGEYQFSGKQIVLPDYATLNNYITQAQNSGLEQREVRQYLGTIVDFAKEGLERSERHYLNPLYEILSTGQNIASQIVDEVLGGHRSSYDPAEAARANLFVYAKQQQAIKALEQYV